MPRPTPEHSAAEPQPKWHGHPGRDRFTGWKPVVPRGRAATALWPSILAGTERSSALRCAGNPCHKNKNSRAGTYRVFAGCEEPGK